MRAFPFVGIPQRALCASRRRAIMDHKNQRPDHPTMLAPIPVTENEIKAWAKFGLPKHTGVRNAVIARQRSQIDMAAQSFVAAAALALAGTGPAPAHSPLAFAAFGQTPAQAPSRAAPGFAKRLEKFRQKPLAAALSQAYPESPLQSPEISGQACPVAEEPPRPPGAADAAEALGIVLTGDAKADAASAGAAAEDNSAGKMAGILASMRAQSAVRLDNQFSGDASETAGSDASAVAYAAKAPDSFGAFNVTFSGPAGGAGAGSREILAAEHSQSLLAAADAGAYGQALQKESQALGLAKALGALAEASAPLPGQAHGGEIPLQAEPEKPAAALSFLDSPAPPQPSALPGPGVPELAALPAKLFARRSARRPADEASPPQAPKRR